MNAFKKTFLPVALVLLPIFLSLQACTGQTAQKNGPTVNALDLARLSGSEWVGTLGYLDYSSAEWDGIPVSMRFDAAKGRSIRFHIKYPGESQYNDSEKLRASRDGRSLDGAVLIERRDDDNTLFLVTEARGKDDGRSADIRMTYIVSDAALTISKSVRLDSDSKYFKRNAYELTRVAQ